MKKIMVVSLLGLSVGCSQQNQPAPSEQASAKPTAADRSATYLAALKEIEVLEADLAELDQLSQDCLKLEIVNNKSYESELLIFERSKQENKDKIQKLKLIAKENSPSNN